MEKPDFSQSAAPSADSPPSYLPYHMPHDQPVTKFHFDLALQGQDRGLRREFATVHEKITNLQESNGNIQGSVGNLERGVSDFEAQARNSNARMPKSNIHPISQDGSFPASFPTNVIRLWRLSPRALTELLLFYKLNFYSNFVLFDEDEGLAASQDSVGSSLNKRSSSEPEESHGAPAGETADIHGFNADGFWSMVEDESPIPSDTLSSLVQRHSKSALRILTCHVGINYDDIVAQFRKMEQRAQARYDAVRKRKADDPGTASSEKKTMTMAVYAKIRDTESFRELIKDPEHYTESVRSPLPQVT